MGQTTSGSSSSEGKTTDSTAVRVMPGNVKAGQVIALVEITGGLDKTIDASHLASEFGSDLQTLLPIIDASEMLGLIKTDKGDVSLTEFGSKFQKTSKVKVKLLRDELAGIEPFKTALDMLQNKKWVSVSEIAESLKRRDIKWHHNDETNELAIQSLLINWAIYAELLSYNGKNQKFHKFA